MAVLNPVSRYRRIAAFAVVMVVIIGGPLVLWVGRPKPISIPRVTRAVDNLFGASYDWYCAKTVVPSRTVVCLSQPNGYYSATFYVQDNGAPALTSEVAPPA